MKGQTCLKFFWEEIVYGDFLHSINSNMARMYYNSQDIEILDNMDNLEELNDRDSDYESVFETETDEENWL